MLNGSGLTCLKDQNFLEFAKSSSAEGKIKIDFMKKQ